MTGAVRSRVFHTQRTEREALVLYSIIADTLVRAVGVDFLESGVKRVLCLKSC